MIKKNARVMQLKNIFTYSLLLLLFSCDQKEAKEFEVKGIIKNAPNQVIYLEEVSLESMRPVIVDSATIGNNGKYSLTTIAKEEGLYDLRLGQNTYPLLTLINDEDKITVDADLQNVEAPYTIKGSEASKKIKDYLENSGAQMRNLFERGKRMDSLVAVRTADSLMTGIKGEQENAMNSLKNYTTDFITKSSSPALALFALGSYQSFSFNPAFRINPYTEEEVSKILLQTANKFPKHATLARFKANIVQAEKTKQEKSLIGKQAPDFTLPDVNGVPVSLRSLKGKYVLVDFWASWCAPCRAENPNVVKAFKNYKDKNFTVLGVSLDKEKGPWVEAIKKDSLSWTHVSDLRFWDSKVVPIYNIEAIPYNVLLDTNGKVIADHLTGNNLERKLAEVIK